MRRLSFLALIATSGLAVSAHAGPDRAPLSAEVTDRVKSELHRAPPSTLVRRLQSHVDEVDTRLRELDARQNNTAQLPRAQEIRQLRDEAIQRIIEQQATLRGKGLADGAGRMDGLRHQVEERFTRFEQLLRRAEASRANGNARGESRELRRLLAQFQPPKPASFEPIRTFSMGKPVPPAQQIKSLTAPRYMTWYTEPPLYASADGELLAVADPVPPAVDCGQTSADIDKNSLDAKVTPEIAALVQSLDYSPTRILDYVTNQITFESYWGSLKGAQGALHSKAGGATDRASLLIAMLREANIPARYVRGTVGVVDARGPRWIGAKTFEAASVILASAGNPNAFPVFDVSGNAVGITLAHVWVEACVPYANYRGTRADITGYRWVPLDPSFRDKTYQAGIAHSTSFDYSGYMARRTNELPSEHYADQVEAAVKTVGPNFFNNTAQDVPYKGKPVVRAFDILPSSLPYRVLSFDAWGSGMTAETALLPDEHRYKLSISPANSTGTLLMSSPAVLSMPDVVLQRLTLAWKGATPSDQSLLDAWKNQSISSAVNCGINVVPEIRRDGVLVATGITAVGLCTTSNQLNLRLTLDDATYATHPRVVNEVTYRNIGAANVHSLHQFAFQTSDRLLTERAARLLNAVRSNQPNSNTDEVLGEFLHVTGLKYLRYVSDAIRNVADLDSVSGESGFHLGLASSQMRVEYLFDVPFAVHRAGLVVDFPGEQFNAVDLTTGRPVWNTFLLAGYAASFLESYVWQENVKTDAISTVRGIQFARETGIEILVLNAANWTAENGKLTSNTDSSLNYSSTDVANLYSNYISAGFTVTLPRSLVQYVDWKGAVYIAQKDDTANPTNPTGVATFAIQRYAGGELVGFMLPELIFGPSVLNAGFSGTGITNDANQDQAVAAVLNSVFGLGLTWSTTLAGDPVNMVNGNMYHVERDISIRGRGLPIIFERSYNSRALADGPLGFGWTHAFNHSLVFRDDNLDGTANAADSDSITSSVIWTDGTGSQKFISISGANGSGVPASAVFAAPKGYFFQLSRQANGTYKLREKNGLTYTFENVAGTINQKAKLISISDRNGNTLTFTYSGAAQNLTSVTDALNRSLTFTYNGSNRIIEIRDWTARSFQYGYDGAGNLTSFKNPLAVAGQQAPVTYEYYADSSTDSSGQVSPLNRAMKKYTLPRGNGMTFEYYANGRVFKHYNTLGETNTFTYNEFRRETVQVNERGNTRRFFFDANGNPTSIVEENGAEQAYTYDCAEPGNPANCANPFNRLSKREALGYTTGYQYDAQGNVMQVTQPSGNTVELSYFDAFNQPGKIKDARGNYTLNKYDAQGNLLQVIKLKNGFGAVIDPTTYVPVSSQIVAWVVNTYDSYGNLASSKRVKDFSTQAGPVVSYTYDSQGLNLLSLTRTGILGNGASGNETSLLLVYDNLGRATTGLRADWYPVQYSYDALDRVTQATDNNNNLRNYLYDANGNAIGDQIVSAGNIADNMSYGFDLSDRRTQSVNSGGYATNYEFDAVGNVAKVTNPDGYNISFEYDTANRMVRAQNERGDSVLRDLDIDGKPRAVTDPNGNTVSYSYYGPEREGRLKRVTRPAITGFVSGKALEYDYDSAGNVVRTAQIPATPSSGSAPAPRETLSSYDELNRLVRSVGPSYIDTVPGSSTSGMTVRPVTTYAYDTLGNVASLAAGSTDASGTNAATDAVTTQMTFEYDDFGRQLKRTNALGKFWVFRYDTNGNLVQSTDARSQSLYHTYLYGARLQCTSRIAPNATCVSNANLLKSYVRNSLGLVTQAYSPEVTYDYSYDAAKRTKTVRDGRGGKTFTYDWSNGNRLNRMVDGEGKETNYLYDAAGRLAGIWTPGGEYISFEWDKGGRLRQKWYPNGASAGYTYNEDNSLVRIENVALPFQISTHTYAYDGFGSRVTRRDELVGYDLRWRFTYDGRGQLTAQYVSHNIDQFGAPGAQQAEALQTSYAYDPLGNIRRQVFVDGSRIDDTINTANQLTQRSYFTAAGAPDGTQLWSHDDNGNVTARDFGGGDIVTYSYDALNRLDTAARPGAYNQTYGYDDQGRRVRKTISGTPNFYLYDGDNLYAEYGSNWSIAPARTTYGPGMDQPLVRDTGIASERRYYHADGQGSVTALTDASSPPLVTWINMYDAWGADFFGSAGPSPLQRYTGREGDETSLHYYRARYYFPYAPRFIQPDPIGYDGGQVNLYAYVSNDPANFTDPYGLTATDPLRSQAASSSCAYAGCGQGTSDEPGLLARLTPGFSRLLAPAAAAEAAETASLLSRLAPLGSAVTAAAAAIALKGDTDRDPGIFYYATYTRLNPETAIVYSGRTSGFGDPNILVQLRGSQQALLNAEGFMPPVLDRFTSNDPRAGPAFAGNSAYFAIRGREQQLIDFYGGAQSVGGTSRNKINGVADFNPLRPAYIGASTELFGTLPDNSPSRLRLGP